MAKSSDPTARRGCYEVRIIVQRGDYYYSVEYPSDNTPDAELLVLLKEEAVGVWNALFPDEGPADDISVICTYYDRSPSTSVLEEA